MQIRLVNFRCYDDKTFDFGQQGLALLSGSSGKGKSTILMAVDFALFGNGNKVISHGKKSCIVELTLPQIKIVRKKGPNHLIVNDSLEDEAGEAFIRQTFGSIFNSVSYIPQNPKKSFVLMSPTDRLEFLESFAFKDFDIASLKEKSKQAIREAHDNLSETIGSCSFAAKLLSEKKQPVKIPFPVKVSSREKYIQNEQVKLKNSILHVKKGKEKLSELTKLAFQYKLLHVQLSESESQCALIKSKLEEQNQQCQRVHFRGKDHLLQLEKCFEGVLKRKEFLRAKATYEENMTKLHLLMQKEEADTVDRLRAAKERLKENGLPSDVAEEIDTWNELLSKKKTHAQLREELNSFVDLDLDNLRSMAEIKDVIIQKQRDIDNALLEKESFTCPHCSGKVRMKEKVLVKTEGLGKEQNLELLIKELNELKHEEKRTQLLLQRKDARDVLKSKIMKLDQEIREFDGENISINECKESLQQRQKILEESREDEKTVQVLEKNLREKIFSKTIASIQKQLAIDEGKIKNIGTCEIAEDKDEDTLRKDIADEKLAQEKLDFLTKGIASLETELSVLTKKIDEILSQIKKLPNEQSTRIEYQDLEKSIAIHEQRREAIEHFLEQVEQWNINNEKVLEYEKLQTDVQKLKLKEIEDRKAYTSACMFRDCILKAESVYVGHLIDSVNTNVQLYLDHFFPDSPMSARIASFKETAKSETKPSIHLEIDYKGIEMELSMLSGGELSRLILSFTLAFADLYNSPLILLDECTSSLDQDLTSAVLEGLKENFGGKLVLIVAHQVVKGVFDKVVEL